MDILSISFFIYNNSKNMEKPKVTYKLSQEDIAKIEELKVVFNEKTNSKTVSKCIDNVYNRLLW